MGRLLTLLVVLSMPAWAQNGHLSADEVQQAIQEGYALKGKPTKNIGFRLGIEEVDEEGEGEVQVLTSREWIMLQAKTSAELYEELPVEKVDTRSLLHILVGIRHTHSIPVIVLKDEKKQTFVRPAEARRIPQTVGNACCGETYYGLHAKFSMDDVARVRAASPEEFFVTVVWSWPDGTVTEYDFKVKKNHFSHLQKN